MKAFQSQDEEINHCDNGLILLKPTLCPNLGKNIHLFKFVSFQIASKRQANEKQNTPQVPSCERCAKININGETLFVPSMQKDDQSPYLTVFSLAALTCEYNH